MNEVDDSRAESLANHAAVSAPLVGAITRFMRFLRLRIRASFPWESLPMAQVEFLQRLAEEPGLRLGELAQKHSMATNTVSTIIQQMVTNGLISREIDPTDRRAVTLSITEHGLASLNAWVRANEELLEVALARMTPQQLDEIAAALPALRALADELDRV